jgi:hypothetical protein
LFGSGPGRKGLDDITDSLAIVIAALR